MKSPITGKEMKLMHEKRVLNFRKEPFEIYSCFYKCEDSREQFTNNNIDELNISQVYNQYRIKYNIPSIDKIKEIRTQYGLPATKMSTILGFGVNSYGLYETGEMPSVSNAKLIHMAEDPKNFIELIKSCESLDNKMKTNYIKKAENLGKEKEKNHFITELKQYFLGSLTLDKYSGYSNPNLEKFTEMVVYFSEYLKPFKTKMNKLLFYSDFLHFKQTGFSISGIRYKAINLGPVPNNYQSIFDFLVREGKISIDNVNVSQNNIGEQFKVKDNTTFQKDLFLEVELQTLDRIVKYFSEMNANQIVQCSHAEKAWIENEKEQKLINYEYAFDLIYPT